MATKLSRRKPARGAPSYRVPTLLAAKTNSASILESFGCSSPDRRPTEYSLASIRIGSVCRPHFATGRDAPNFQKREKKKIPAQKKRPKKPMIFPLEPKRLVNSTKKNFFEIVEKLAQTAKSPRIQIQFQFRQVYSVARVYSDHRNQGFRDSRLSCREFDHLPRSIRNAPLTTFRALLTNFLATAR